MGFTSIDADSIKDAYEDVRNDSSDTLWAVFKYEGNLITASQTGIDSEKFLAQFGDDERAYGYIRLEIDDGKSRRCKFLFVTWIGPDVNTLSRALVSTDKALVKSVIKSFSAEVHIQAKSELDFKQFMQVLRQASGTHYGSGI